MTLHRLVSLSIVSFVGFPLLLGCGGTIGATSSPDEVSLFASTAATSDSLVQTCAALTQSCQLDGRGCQATQRFCLSATEDGICAALNLGCGEHAQLCTIFADRCGAADPGVPQDPDDPGAKEPLPGEPGAPGDETCPKGSCDGTPPPSNDAGGAPPAGKGTPGATPTPIDPATCCPAIDPCIASNGTDCAAMAQACDYDLSNIIPEHIAAKAAALKEAYCSGS